MRLVCLATVSLLALAACKGGRETRLDGEWAIHLTLDQPVRASGRATTPPRDTVTGAIYITRDFPDFPAWDPVPAEMRPYAVGRYFVDFGPLFGRAPRPDRTRPRGDREFDGGSWQEVLARIDGDSVSIALTPRVADAGVSLEGRLRGDTIAGRWMEHAYGGGARGRFRMWRRSRSAWMDSAVAYARRGAHRPAPPLTGRADTLRPVNAADPSSDTLPAADDRSLTRSPRRR